MKKISVILFLCFFSLNLQAQATYSGFIDKYPIELVTNMYSDGMVTAFYMYTKFDEPIKTDGTCKNGVLILTEKDSTGKKKASMVFNNFSANNTQVEGAWKDLGTNKELKISLTKIYDIDYGDAAEWANRELLQPVSLPGKYFKLVISKEKGSTFARATGIKILEKKTDRLIQQLSLDCQLSGADNVSTGDYNFDGIADFSVFEQGYAGPNTSSLYFLFDPKTGKYFKSSFAGTSLDFDPVKKRVYEHNQCCAGRSHMNAEYKVVNNKMVLIKRTCLEYDEQKEDFKEVKCQ